jgi:uncharacterized protein YndB with AHSA1/START domain
VNSVVIERPVEEVWDFFTHFENISTWYANIRRVRPLSDRPLGIGSPYEMVFGLGPLEFGGRIHVSEFEPHRQIVFEGVSARTAFIFERVGGGTRFTKTQQRHGLFAKIAKPFDGLVEKKRDKDMVKLKHLLEDHERLRGRGAPRDA